MKNVIFFLVLAVSVSVSAQNIGCDGSRYVASTFTDVTTTTVQFGANTNLLGQTQDLFMDIYEPTGDLLAHRPLLILAHGGSFVGGTRQELDATCREYAQKGYVTATVDYRLWPIIFGFPDSTDILGVTVSAVHDLKAAVRYFYGDASFYDLYRVDTNYVIIGGYSAGAIAALHMAYMDDNDEVTPQIQAVIDGLGGLEGSSGNASYSSKVHGALSFSGALHKSAWMSAGEVPLVSVHGTGDATVPYTYGVANFVISVEGSGVLQQRANELGIPNMLYSILGGGHVNIYTEALYAPQREEFSYLCSAFLHDTIICPGIVLGQNDPTNLSNLTVSPNPATDLVGVKVPAQADALVVTDLMGRTLQTFSAQTTHINVADWSAGIYILVATQHGAVVGSTRIQKL